MQKYTEIVTLKISLTQKKTLNKMRERNIRVADFIRKAIKEKIDREYQELKPKPKKEHCPF